MSPMSCRPKPRWSRRGSPPGAGGGAGDELVELARDSVFYAMAPVPTHDEISSAQRSAVLESQGAVFSLSLPYDHELSRELINAHWSFHPLLIDAFFPEVGIATLELLERFGHEVIYPRDQTCCGQQMADNGYNAEVTVAEALFVRNFSGFDYIEASEGSCVHHVRWVIYNGLNVWGRHREVPSPPKQTLHSWYKANRAEEK
jgi:Cysteine-rich domain